MFLCNPSAPSFIGESLNESMDIIPFGKVREGTFDWQGGSQFVDVHFLDSLCCAFLPFAAKADSAFYVASRNQNLAIKFI